VSGFARLSLADRGELRIERPETPAHVAGLCLVEAGPLLREDGELDLAAIRCRLERRLSRVPELRRVVGRPPPLCGPPLWVDDTDFSIERHVRAARVDPPGDEASLLRTAERLLRTRLDRSRPLWELWFLTGLAGDRLGMLFKVHHALADGLAAIALVASLADIDGDATGPPPAPWRPEPTPPARALLADGLRRRAGALAATLRHPVRLVRELSSVVGDVAETLRAAASSPRTSLHALPGRARLLRAVHLDLEEARASAHAHGATVNDVLLAVVAGGLRELLLARGEPVADRDLNVSVPAALRGAGAARELGNAVGVMIVAVPPEEPDARRRLERIAARTRAAKAEQQPAYVQDLMAWLAALGLSQPFARHQRLVHTFVTNVPGPRETISLLGARIESVLPLVGLAGNVTVLFAALSYRGRFDVAVVADAAACPDVDVVVDGMSRAWRALTAAPPNALPAACRAAAGPVTRVVGLGAEDRGDDAAGLLVARLVRTAAPPGVEVVECGGDAGALLECLDGADRVIVVDAARGGRPGSLERLPLAAIPRAAARSTHGMGLAEALGVAAELGVLPADVRVYVVHGRRFDPGPVGPEVAAGVRTAAGLVLRDIAR
jgi:WS/DGAT/MGAT family acyltransferase